MKIKSTKPKQKSSPLQEGISRLPGMGKTGLHKHQTSLVDFELELTNKSTGQLNEIDAGDRDVVFTEIGLELEDHILLVLLSDGLIL